MINDDLRSCGAGAHNLHRPTGAVMKNNHTEKAIGNSKNQKLTNTASPCLGLPAMDCTASDNSGMLASFGLGSIARPLSPHYSAVLPPSHPGVRNAPQEGHAFE